MERSLLENNVDYNIVLNLPGTMGFLVDICLGLTNPFTPTSSNFKLCRAIKCHLTSYFAHIITLT